MALGLAEPGVPGRTEIHGVFDLACDPDRERGEFGIVVRGGLTGQGLGHLLMARIIAYARSRDFGEIFGDVLAENRPMLDLARILGFNVERRADDPDIVRITLKL